MATEVSPRIARATADFARRVRARFGPRVRELALFGSQARGDDHAESDTDVFVRVDGLNEAERRDVFDMAAEVSLESLVLVQAFAPLPDEYAWLSRYECRIVRDIASEGVPL